jgi:hypothetical protein
LCASSQFQNRGAPQHDGKACAGARFSGSTATPARESAADARTNVHF